MPVQSTASQPFSPLLDALRKQIAVTVRESGIDSIIVAAPSWKEFQRIDCPLPEGVFITRATLKSKRVAVKVRSNGLVNARWPEDGLLSIIEPNLCFILEGPVALRVGDYKIHCLPGQAVLMPPGTPFSDGSLLGLDESRANSGYCRKLSLRPWAGGVECWLNYDQNGRHWSYHNPGEHCYVQNAKAYQYLATLGEELIACPPEYRLHCTGLLSALVAVLIREIRERHAFDAARSKGMFLNTAIHPPLQKPSPIEQAQFYINSHLNEQLSIESLAKRAYMSRAYFTRQFRLVTGKSVVEYITQSRLQKAKVLLLNTKWPVNQISSFVGISPDRLRSIFLQYEQLTPSDFRRQNQSGHET